MTTIPRSNWVAIVLATLLMWPSYFSYGAAFVDDGDSSSFDVQFAAVGLTIAPFVFIVLAFVSRNPNAPKQVLRAMGVLLLIGLPVGLLDPLLGAATGFSAGGAFTLNRPPVGDITRWRIYAVVFCLIYCLVLRVVVPPAGVFAGATVPFLLIGFADEFAVRASARTA